jgi:hypothetical protein
MDRHLARGEKVLPDRARAKAARADSHVQTPSVRNDDLGDTLGIGTGAMPPKADGRAAHTEIKVAVDDGYDETGTPRDRRRRRLPANRRDLRAAELALRGVRSAAGSDEPDEQQCDP